MHLNVKHTYTTQPNNDEKMQSYLKYLDEVGTSVSRLESFSALHNTLKSWYTNPFRMLRTKSRQIYKTINNGEENCKQDMIPT